MLLEKSGEITVVVSVSIIQKIKKKETVPDIPMSVHTGCCSCAWDLLKEVAIIFITSTIVWLQVKQQGGNTAVLINRKLD